MTTQLQPEDGDAWQKYVFAHPYANYCHDIAWSRIIRRTYGRKDVYFVHRGKKDGRIKGVLPAFCLISPFSGGWIVSLPYLDWGGIVSDDQDTSNALLRAFFRTAEHTKVRSELRCIQPLAGIRPPTNVKVGMIVHLDGLDESSYWKKLHPKVRNQIRKAEKSGVEVRWGRLELLPDFYSVFSRNMRDLGSPVHSRPLFENLLKEIHGAEIGTAYREGRCIGGLVRILWRDTLAIPWSSTLRAERINCPNNALYWESIRYAFHTGCSRIDLGRSTRDEGTHRFKLQWLAREIPAAWYQFDEDGMLIPEIRHAASSILGPLSRIWSILPLSIANALGPRVRPFISA